MKYKPSLVYNRNKEKYKVSQDNCKELFDMLKIAMYMNKCLKSVVMLVKSFCKINNTKSVLIRE